VKGGLKDQIFAPSCNETSKIIYYEKLRKLRHRAIK
jgi:hypothetical protein